MTTIRELFHNLGNKHNLITVGCGATQEIVEDCLEGKCLDVVKDDLLEIKKNLKALVESAIEADKIATEIHDRIYKIIDPDTGKSKQ